MGKLKFSAVSTAVSLALGFGASAAQADTYTATQDTSVYQFLDGAAFGFTGNLGQGTGESGGVLVFNHENVHGAQALVGFDSGSVLSDAALAGDYTATLWLYSISAVGSGGFVTAEPGMADADNTFTPGTATLKTDVFLQTTAFDEAGTIHWADITSTGTKATLTQSSVGGWLSVDVTDLIAEWGLLGASAFGFALSSEAYAVQRADNGGLLAQAFCDTESGITGCTGSLAPYLEIASVSAVPVPAAVWLLGSALVGLVGVSRRRSDAIAIA